MADKTGIEWTDATWNPFAGCSIVSPGCTHCYAMQMAARIERMGTAPHYAGLTQPSKAGPVWSGRLALASEAQLTQPLRWKRGRRIFVNSMSDLFHEDAPDEWIDRVFAGMALSPQHTFQILTKRPERMRAYIGGRWAYKSASAERIGYRIMEMMPDEGVAYPSHWSITASALIHGATPNLPEVAFPRPDLWPLPNVWLGVSAERQQEADARIPILLDTPAAVRFISAEPLLEAIQLRAEWMTGHDDGPCPVSDPDCLGGEGECHDACERRSRIGWVIAGGESGPKARPMHPDWARSLRDQCAAAGVAFHFKQWGNWLPGHYSESRHTMLLDPAQGQQCGMTLGAPPHSGDYVHDWGDGFISARVPKTKAGRLLDGVEHSAFPGVR